MLEYFAYKKFKKNKGDKAEKDKGKGKENDVAKPDTPATAAGTSAAASATETPVLDDDDKQFLERLTTPSADGHDDDAEDEGPRPPLPPRVRTPELTWDSDSESFLAPKDVNAKPREVTAAAREKKKSNRLSLPSFMRKKSTDDNNNNNNNTSLSTSNNNKLSVPEPEVDREKDDLSRVLDDLNLSARNSKAFALSQDSAELVQKFTLVLKDLVNGVPTAVHDLTSLLDDKDGALAKNFEKLPRSLKKLVTQLPDKLTSTLAPELLAVAAEAQGLAGGKEEAAAARGGLKGAAKRIFMPNGKISDLVTKPGAIVGMLKAIMNALKVRWPAFIGTNVIWSVAIFLLMFVLWYCHKRGRETRLEREKSDVEHAGSPHVIDGRDRIEELPDDPTLPAASSGQRRGQRPIVVEPPAETVPRK
ncbi:hypothetical protein QBC46DRAFT_314974 [Diplogelasinospora grovesii]|uniref:Ring-like domain-containing protein n=1 Tax=Diplogelasinospora grovesii TaxID=303347 RepID=A0AAN6N640_9PEZI|nr:hypothetical protein QBC46DRAFT_314974 [Diplogelasinospora grovesii]